MAWLKESPKLRPTRISRVLAGAAVAAVVVGALVVVFGFAFGTVAILTWWPLRGYTPDPYFRFLSDSAVAQWAYTSTAGASLAALGVFGYRALENHERRPPTRDRSTTMGRAAAICVAVATCLLVAAVIPSYLATPTQRVEFTDLQFPTSMSAAFNNTYRISAPLHVEQGRFLEGDFQLWWSVWPGYTERASASVMALDENGSRIVPASELYYYLVPSTAEYVIVVTVPPYPSMCSNSICHETFPPAQVTGNLSVIDPSVDPPLQLALEAFGLGALSLCIGFERVRRRARTTGPGDAAFD